jgi:hypothetical protein
MCGLNALLTVHVCNLNSLLHGFLRLNGELIEIHRKNLFVQDQDK